MLINLTDRMMDMRRGLPGNPVKAMIVVHTPSCPYCKMYLPIVRQVAPRYRGRLTVFSVDASKNKKLGQAFVREGVPATVLLFNGQPVWAKAGLIDAAALTGILDAFSR